ncbi:MAG TPA: hypothetical protein VFN68_12990 [Acidimicrobiales bacterium]|nr:hypothetical protein [Acidimicrobiales bacterium]
MSRRIEIELTSARPDGTWTWRAAGAREPKGVLDGGLLYEGAKTGDVLRAEAEFELEGIIITSVTAPKSDRRAEPQRIEIVGPGRPEGPGVTTQLVGRGGRRPGERHRERGDRGPRERAGAHPQGGRGERPERQGGGPRGERRQEPGRDAGRRSGEGRPGSRAGTPGAGGERDRRGAVRTSSTSERSRGRRLNPGSAHRQAVMDSLPPEQQAIAEQLLRGGIPAVRTALHLEREKATAEGRPAPNTEELLALAESLLPRLRAAEWRDRAEAAVGEIANISLRDLRSVVAGADLARDDETRALGAQLREGLDRRVKKLHDDWAADITAQLDAGRVVRAVRLSGRAPDPSARLETDLANRLTEAASAMLSAETAPDLWVALVEAVAESPIRRSVTPTGMPAEAPAEVKKTAHQLSGSIPGLAKMLGVTIPPPPAPLPGRRRGEPASRPGGRQGGRAARSGGEPAAAPPASGEEAGSRGPAPEPAPTQPEPAAEAAPAATEPEPTSTEAAPTATEAAPTPTEAAPAATEATGTAEAEAAQPATEGAQPEPAATEAATATTEATGAQPQPAATEPEPAATEAAPAATGVAEAQPEAAAEQPETAPARPAEGEAPPSVAAEPAQAENATE